MRWSSRLQQRDCPSQLSAVSSPHALKEVVDINPSSRTADDFGGYSGLSLNDRASGSDEGAQVFFKILVHRYFSIPTTR